MNNLTDLELEKRIAEIEGITVSESVIILKGNPISTGRGLITDEYIEFNPLTDDALCFQLMKKHDIDNSRGGVRTETGEAVYCAKKHDSNAELVFSRSRNKVILLAIVEANNESNSTI